MGTFRVEQGSEERTFWLVGDLDLLSSDELVKYVMPALQGDGDLYLDVARLEFMDSAGVRALITLCRALGDRGRVVLRSPGLEVTRLLELIRADTFPNLLVEGNGSAPWGSRSSDPDLTVA